MFEISLSGFENIVEHALVVSAGHVGVGLDVLSDFLVQFFEQGCFRLSLLFFELKDDVRHEVIVTLASDTFLNECFEELIFVDVFVDF